ncbi:MAG: hypothetical protein M3R41_09785 [Pseudomonadota bacterium]|nr:hypothetical protein [Pseudomonadota bacterium]
MRYALILPLALAAAPAAAHEAPANPAPTLDTAATLLSDPMVQEGVATLVTQLAGALLDTHVGPLARYTDPHDHIRADTTLADLVARNDPAYARHLHDKALGAATAAGQAARDAVAMRAELKATAARVRAILGKAQDAVASAN